MIKEFNPSEYKFIFNFTEDTCEKLRTGFCPIMHSKLDDIDYDFKKDRNKFSKCQNIYYGIKSGEINNIKNLPLIHKCSCGHYICTDGQHRICVAQKMRINIKVNETDVNDMCFKCIKNSGNNEKILNDIVEYADELLYRVKYANDFLNACNIYRNITSPNEVSKLKLANDFFSVSYEALLYTMMMEVIKLCDTDNDSMTVYRFFSKCSGDTSLNKVFKSLNIKKGINKIIQNFNKFWECGNTKRLVEDIKTRRDKYYAHSDKEYFLDIKKLTQETSVTFEELETLLTEFRTNISEVYTLITGNLWSPGIHQKELTHSRNCSDLYNLLDKIIID